MSHTIYILSGGSGTSGEQLVNTILAQYPDSTVQVVIIPHIRGQGDFMPAIEQASFSGGTIVHTMVDAGLRSELHLACQKAGVFEVDLMRALSDRLTSVTGQTPLGQPGLYRQLHQDYYERVAAIEFSMAHDDGKDPEKWPQADLLLVGVSRVGKTPLSLYLSVLGWKAANTPWVPDIPLPVMIDQLDPGRVIGLTIEPGQLLAFREERQRRIGAPGAGSYTDPKSVFDEIEQARAFFRRRGYTVLDVTDKPIETTAEEVQRLITSRFPPPSRQG